jgi:cystathionine beta-lyase/cystathionine gamma-synthase
MKSTKMSETTKTRAAEDEDVVALRTRRIWSETVSSLQVSTPDIRKTYRIKSSFPFRLAPGK